MFDEAAAATVVEGGPRGDATGVENILDAELGFPADAFLQDHAAVFEPRVDVERLRAEERLGDVEEGRAGTDLVADGFFSSARQQFAE